MNQKYFWHANTSGRGGMINARAFLTRRYAAQQLAQKRHAKRIAGSTPAALTITIFHYRKKFSMNNKKIFCLNCGILLYENDEEEENEEEECPFKLHGLFILGKDILKYEYCNLENNKAIL